MWGRQWKEQPWTASRKAHPQDLGGAAGTKEFTSAVVIAW